MNAVQFVMFIALGVAFLGLIYACIVGVSWLIGLRIRNERERENTKRARERASAETPEKCKDCKYGDSNCETCIKDELKKDAAEILKDSVKPFLENSSEEEISKIIGDIVEKQSKK